MAYTVRVIENKLATLGTIRLLVAHRLDSARPASMEEETSIGMVCVDKVQAKSSEVESAEQHNRKLYDVSHTIATAMP